MRPGRSLREPLLGRRALGTQLAKTSDGKGVHLHAGAAANRQEVQLVAPGKADSFGATDLADNRCTKNPAPPPDARCRRFTA